VGEMSASLPAGVTLEFRPMHQYEIDYMVKYPSQAYCSRSRCDGTPTHIHRVTYQHYKTSAREKTLRLCDKCASKVRARGEE
jgi:hypothetical protein